MDTKLNSAVKKEIRKQIKINGSHMGTVRTAIETQFPSIVTGMVLLNLLIQNFLRNTIVLNHQ